jgi:hypothetical protein
MNTLQALRDSTGALPDPSGDSCRSPGVRLPTVPTLQPSQPGEATKQLLAGPVQAAAVLQTLLPAEIARAVDWSTLRPDTREVPAKMRASTHTELAFVARLEAAAHPVEVVIYVLIEHQISPDPTMPVRAASTLSPLDQ